MLLRYTRTPSGHPAHPRSSTTVRRFTGLIAAVALLFAGTAMADPPGVQALQRLLSATKMGRVTRVFPGPDGMTGVVLQKGFHHTIAYLTPNGQYVFFGMMMNLATDQNTTLAEGARLIRKYHIVTGFAAADATALAYRLHAIVFGNAHARDQIILAFDTANPKSKTAVADLLDLAHRQLRGNMAKHLAYRFLPDGPAAGWLLSGKAGQRRARLYDYLHDKFPGTSTASGRNRARYNANAFRNFPIARPMAILDLPAARIDLVMPASHAIAHLQHQEH